MSGSVHYFAYGSNMNPARVRARQMTFDDHFAASLHGYQLAFNKRSVKYPGAASANVVAATDALTQGVCYRLPSADAIAAMDPFEGYPHRYRRELLPVRAAHGVVSAWVYIANDAYITEGLRPARWYLEHLLAGRAFLSDDYHAELAATACLPDSEVEPP